MILDIIFGFIFCMFFYWTGEVVRTIVMLGKYKPDFALKRNDETGKLDGGKSQLIGILFWISIPAIIYFS